MCFSAKASLSAYILGTIGSLYLLINGDKYDKHIGLFSLTFVQMQLAEFFMWIDKDCNKNINHYATIFARYILFLQPLSIILGALLFKTTNISNNLDAYKKIIPCGIKDKEVTNLISIKKQKYNNLSDILIKKFLKEIKN